MDPIRPSVAAETTTQRVRRLSERVSLEPFKFHIAPIKGNDKVVVISALRWRKDNDDPEGRFGWGEGGEYMVRDTYSDDAILKRFFVAVRDYQEHEVRESFLVDGRRVFDPHMPLDILALAADHA